jgi:small-conductance mechanosensitive channel
MNAAQRFMMVKNVMQIFIWGLWFLIAMAMCHVSNTWLVVVSGGLSTGIGFASKDILENIYYGISLMAGRIKIGDLIVCDGVRGTVSSISYTSTMINTTDGSVIAFQNSQLFTKNYKNMTRNHGYELHILDVGVAYGTNIQHAKEVIKNAVMPLENINKKKGVSVVLKELGDSALVLKVIVWVNVFTQYSDDGIILEAIYNALNENNIEIPFPQTDIHIKDINASFASMIEAQKTDKA